MTPGPNAKTSKKYRLSVVMNFAHNFCGQFCSKVFSVTKLIYFKQKKIENQN
jgi:hypothetical protein